MFGQLSCPLVKPTHILIQHANVKKKCSRNIWPLQSYMCTQTQQNLLVENLYKLLRLSETAWNRLMCCWQLSKCHLFFWVVFKLIEAFSFLSGLKLDETDWNLLIWIPQLSIPPQLHKPTRLKSTGTQFHKCPLQPFLPHEPTYRSSALPLASSTSWYNGLYTFLIAPNLLCCLSTGALFEIKRFVQRNVFFQKSF